VCDWGMIDKGPDWLDVRVDSQGKCWKASVMDYMINGQVLKLRRVSMVL
jgi:hypothetical protein